MIPRMTPKPTLEDRLRPDSESARLSSDLLWLGLLAAMAVLLPVWPPLRLNEAATALSLNERTFNDMLGQTLSVYLLPAMGMLLAMRRGAIDLSVWANMALGGAVAAIVIRATSAPDPSEFNSPIWGLLAGAAAGATVGLVNGIIVTRLRVPSPVVTIIVAGLVTLAMGAIGNGDIDIPGTAFAHWHIEQNVMSQEPLGDSASEASPPAATRVSAPLSVTRMLAVVFVYGLTMTALMFRKPDRRGAGPDNRTMLALAASGLLSAVGGGLWLIENQSTPMPDQLIGTWRIPAAAVLAGALLLAGPGRTLLAGICLPAAMGVAVAWRDHWPCARPCMDAQWLVLIAMALLAQLCIGRWGKRGQTGKRGLTPFSPFEKGVCPLFPRALVPAAGAMLLMAAAGQMGKAQETMRILAGAMAIAAAGLLVIGAIRDLRRAHE